MNSFPIARPTGTQGTAPIRFLDVPKPGGGIRRLATLDAEDRRAYADAVARVVPRVETALGADVLADRTAVRGSHIVVADWRRARRAFQARLAARLDARRGGAVFVGDVRSCFTSIDPSVVERALRRLGCAPPDAERVESVLRGFAARGTVGLPVGPSPSAPLANAVLLRADRAIRAQGVDHLRWVDDVVAVCDDRAAAIRAHEAFHRALAEDGLQANQSKTTILTDSDEAVRRLLGAGGYSPAAHERAMLRPP